MGSNSSIDGQGEGSTAADPRLIFRDGRRVEKAIQDALRDVRILHKKMGVALVGMRDGRIVSIEPDQIRIDE